MADHAKLSPSGAHRWMHCPGSIILEAAFPDDSSQYAAEGTLAHDIAAECLEDDRSPHEFIGKRYEVDGFIFTVSHEMAEHVADYMSLVREYAQGGTLLVERKVDFSPVIAQPDSFGTSDAIIIKQDTLTVVDLKYGMGVVVSAENNPQLMLYALGALNDYGDLTDFEHVCMVIHQPRLNAVSECWMSVADLEAFGRQALIAAQTVSEAAEVYGVSETWNEAYLRADEKACKFCKAKGTCPALRQEVEAVVPASAASVEDMKSFLTDVDVEALSSAMSKVELVEQWCKGVREEAFRRLKDGIDVPGFKIVTGRMGNRKWSDEAAVEAAFKSYRFKIDQMYDLKLISPTKAEKLLSDNPRRWAKLEKLITRDEGKPSVAPVTDRRPAKVVTNVADDLRALAFDAGDTTAN